MQDILERVTRTHCEPRPLTLDELSVILYYAYGNIARRLKVNWNSDPRRQAQYTTYYGMRRGTPSGGGLYACEIYWVCGSTGPLEPGIYYYDGMHHAMIRLYTGDATVYIRDAVAAYPSAMQTDQFLLITLDSWKLAYKYTSFAYHVGNQDLGTLLASLQLLAVGFHSSLSPLLWYRDERLNRMLGLNPERESVAAVLPIPTTQIEGASPEERRPLLTTPLVTTFAIERSREVISFQQNVAMQLNSLVDEEVRPEKQMAGLATPDTSSYCGEQILCYAAVNQYKDNKSLRRKLINLRRDISNMRLTGNPANLSTLAELLSLEQYPCLHAWLNLWERYQAACAQGETVLNQELRQQRAVLKETFQIEDFRKGVMLSSSLLDEAVERYLMCDLLNLNREQRTVERSLLEYLFRMACKTSPFSTFTPVCLGRFVPGEAEEGHEVELWIKDMQKQSFPRFNMVILSRLSAQILLTPQVCSALKVQLTNGWHLEGQYVVYVRRKPGQYSGNGETTTPMDTIQEHIIRLPLNALLKSIIDWLSDGHAEVLQELVAHIETALHSTGKRAPLEEYLHHLLRLGLLIAPVLQVDIHLACQCVSTRIHAVCPI